MQEKTALELVNRKADLCRTDQFGFRSACITVILAQIDRSFCYFNSSLPKDSFPVVLLL